jgi:hypothetical protein
VLLFTSGIVRFIFPTLSASFAPSKKIYMSAMDFSLHFISISMYRLALIEFCFARVLIAEWFQYALR